MMKRIRHWDELSETARNILELAVSDDMQRGVTVNFVIGKKAPFETGDNGSAPVFTPEIVDELRSYADHNDYGDGYKISRLDRYVSVRQTVLEGRPLPPADETVQL